MVKVSDGGGHRCRNDQRGEYAEARVRVRVRGSYG